MEDPTNEPLDELLSKLPRTVAVPRDLWPEIARDIKRRPRNMRDVALAASFAILCMAGALLWAVLHGRPAGTGNAVMAHARTAGFDEPRDPAYLAARADLEKSFHERLAILDPATRAKIESSLAVVRQAHEQIRQALAAQPADPVLEHLLESTWHDEFDLYDSVVRGTQPSLLRS
jgi:hypothetical protein